MTKLAITLVVLAGIVSGCGGDDTGSDAARRCDSETRADVYSAGMTKSGAEGKFSVVLVVSEPAPPDKGDNSWTIEIKEVGTDTAVDNADVIVTPFMVDHGHGTPVVPTVSAGDSAGRYLVSPINLWMPGYWELSLDLAAELGSVTMTDTVLFGFCIEG